MSKNEKRRDPGQGNGAHIGNVTDSIVNKSEIVNLLRLTYLIFRWADRRFLEMSERIEKMRGEVRA